MRDADCAAFLQWCLPRLGLRWAGFRRVRGTVCKRIARRIRALGLADLEAYRARLEADDDEWQRLDALCRIPISRFWRDRRVFDSLAHDVLPALAAAARDRGDRSLSIWSAGCASGEEPYSLRLAWRVDAEAAFPSLGITIVATDVDETLLARARAGLYRRGSLRDLPPRLVGLAFEVSDGLYRVREWLRRDVTFLRQDIRRDLPDGPFDLILCRNLVFTYFDGVLQTELLDRVCRRLRPGGALVIGVHEFLPASGSPLARWGVSGPIYRFLPS
ncbi:CheR family methyltransferase [Caldovatus sediminis]|nr:protein-glutamate O-methyltransferase CheR [Caldovatus sediminis]